MKKTMMLIAGTLLFSANMWAQGTQSIHGMRQESSMVQGEIKEGLEEFSSFFMVEVNTMDAAKKAKINEFATAYRSKRRSVKVGDVASSMFTGGVTAVINVLGNELLELAKIRARQKKSWQEMRQKECVFIDSLQSIKGQRDFYSNLSTTGPLDPSDMNFDGITLSAQRDGVEMLKIVCHIDTTRLDHMFMHSKFYLVVDTVVFRPYNSFLPNFQANRISASSWKNLSVEEKDYWNTISHFDFHEYRNPVVSVKMDIYSSWINELVQVSQDVKLGSFSLKIPISEEVLRDSVYVYYRSDAIAHQQPTIMVDGDCFVVPRSYMPVSVSSPSWGTGEYKMKVVLSETCQYNPQANRAKNWHRDYKQLVRMRKNGKVQNEYVSHILSTMRENQGTILKAIYTPAFNAIAQELNPNKKTVVGNMQQVGATSGGQMNGFMVGGQKGGGK